MPIPWVAIGALSSFGSFAYTVLKNDASNDEIIEYLNKLEIKIDEIIHNQSQLITSIHKLPDMVGRVVESALVDQNYSYLNSYFSAFMELSSDRKRRRYVRKNFERIRELFEYTVDYEKRIDGQLNLMNASEQMYVMMLQSETGITLMKRKFIEKTDEIEGFVDDVESKLVGYDQALATRYLKHRYIASQNYNPPMKINELKIQWRDNWVRDCIKPGESDFKYQLDFDVKSSWSCPSPNRTIDGAEFKRRFRRIKSKVNHEITSSAETTKNFESHKALLEKVYQPYIDKLIKHQEEYSNKNLFLSELDGEHESD
ncbi:MAG: hypothetical protein KBT63_04495 [Porticoccaceae bacterium]|nr:hypothetical protein [Porticoccaceae bacterium]